QEFPSKLDLPVGKRNLGGYQQSASRCETLTQIGELMGIHTVPAPIQLRERDGDQRHFASKAVFVSDRPFHKRTCLLQNVLVHPLVRQQDEPAGADRPPLSLQTE